MQDLALEQIGDRGEPDMRMRPHVEALAQDELGRPHLVPEDEGTHHLPPRRGQGPAHLEPAQVAGARHDHGLDQVGRGLASHRGSTAGCQLMACSYPRSRIGEEVPACHPADTLHWDDARIRVSHVDSPEESAMVGLSLLSRGTLAACMLLAATAAARAADPDLGLLEERVARGFKIAPVPLNLAGLDRNLVGLGSYIVNAQGGCNDCHTNPPYAPGGDPFAGPAEEGQCRGLPGRRHGLRPVHLAPTSRPTPRGARPGSPWSSSSR